MSGRDPYQVLGVSKTASQDEIRRAYKKLARTHHPDRNPGDAAAEKKFKESTAAYELIETEEKRKLFDEFGHQVSQPGFDPEKARAQAAYARAGGFRGRGGGGTGGPDFGPDFDLSDLFGDVFRQAGGPGPSGGFRRRGPRPRRGADVTTRLSVAFVDAVMGTERNFRITVPQPDGTSQVVSTQMKVPPGVGDGQKLRLKGRGQPGQNGGPPGDLFVRIDVQPHGVFTREGADITARVPITVGEALAGAEIQVQTLEGRARVRVPQGAQSGQRLRLRGQGGPTKVGRGDFYVELSVRVPKDPSEAVKEAAQRLDESYAEEVRAERGEES
ncbi:MAG: J domain-containing protein [Myxococcota bacterium]